VNSDHGIRKDGKKTTEPTMDHRGYLASDTKLEEGRARGTLARKRKKGPGREKMLEIKT